MKKRLLKILMLLFLIGNLTFSEYVVKDGKVFYDGKEVLRADIGSFRILNNKIAVDSQNIYFLGSRTIKSEKNAYDTSEPVYKLSSDSGKLKIDKEEYDVKKFKLISSNVKNSNFYFLKYDKKIYVVYGYNHSVFFSEILNVDYETFESVSKNLVKDKNKVYFVNSFIADSHNRYLIDFGIKEIKGITPKNFKVIADNLRYNLIFTENNGKLYFLNLYPLVKYEFTFEELSQMDNKTFKPFDYKFIKDKNNVYYLYGYDKFIKFEEADAKTFEVIGNGYARDKSNIYFLYPNLEYMMPIKMEADRKSFNLIKVGEDYTSYARDKKNIYCDGRILEGADYKTFRIFKEKDENGEEIVKIKDKNHEYDENCLIKDRNRF